MFDVARSNKADYCVVFQLADRGCSCSRREMLRRRKLLPAPLAEKGKRKRLPRHSPFVLIPRNDIAQQRKSFSANEF